ncbi:MAG TPA: class I SAM-dependent methyltransferase [Candidatus Acidoferrum sp.]|nr:class I SAM-dependent methyltransferase [Candidatus Acidoferrum sp.]
MAEVMTQKEPLPAGVKTRASCRSCQSSQLVDVLDFGNPFVSNFADVPDASHWPRVPLELVLCADCTLLQLRHTTPSDWLYRRYWYKSGVNPAMRAALADIANKAAQFVGLRSGDSVLDIGCNDGTLLRSYQTSGIERVGFEPAENLACEAAGDKDRIINDFFSARPVADEQFRVITSIAMFYDIEDPNAFVADIASILAKDGVWVIEMHYLPLTLSRNAFDAVCHEHLEYYSLHSLEALLAKHGLEVADVDLNEVNGGSVRAYVVHRGSPAACVFERWGRVESARAAERRLALEQPDTYEHFGARVRHMGERLRAFLQKERARGKEISAYGASTKGNTLLQVFGLDSTMIRTAAERNPEKWGKYTVGTWIPIVSEAEARAHADYFLVLPWHFLTEIRNREREFLERGGKLVAPLPEPRIIDSAGTHRLS